MKPLLKLHSISFGLATAITFSLWTLLVKMTELNSSFKILLGAIVSLGIYRLIATLIISLTKKSSWLKKKFLGQYYLEGTWVGFYIGYSGNVRYLIECFEQEIDSLTIRGKSWDENFQRHSDWTSSSVYIDVEHGKISYMYDVSNLKHASSNHGIAIFGFERSNQNKEAIGLDGYSADLHLNKKMHAREIKICHKCDSDETAALQKAVELYAKNREILKKV